MTARIKVETPYKNDNEANANHAKQMAEIKTKTKEHDPPGDTPAKLNETWNPIDQVRRYYTTEGKKKAKDQAVATKNPNPGGI